MTRSRPTRRRWGIALALSAILVCSFNPAGVDRAAATPARPAVDAKGAAPLVSAAEWERFARRFVTAEGRVVDRENGGVAHSESQGYGMILAVYARERRAFDRIWRFTRRELQVRESDDLLAWRWDPRSIPRVADANNATDGDILVAYALLRAAAAWSDARYAREADRIVEDIGDKLLARVGDRIILRAADFGFDRIAGNEGPVVNPSYYIFAAFRLFEVVRPEYPWRRLARDGLALLSEARTGRIGLVPDWVAVSTRAVRPAAGFAERSSYDAVRVPLYVLHGGLDPAHVAAFDRAWNRTGPGHPLDYHLGRERALGAMSDPGYRAVAALVACAVRGVPVPAEVARFRPTTYFASSLHLIALAVLRRDYPQCLDAPRRAESITIASHDASPFDVWREPAAKAEARAPEARRERASAAHDEDRPLSFSDRIMRKRWLPGP